jgi:hypothetical protein
MADSAPTRRRFQFRLRTLLIGVTLLAAACAIAKLAIENRRLARERDEAELQRVKAVQAKEDAILQASESRDLAARARAGAEISAQEARNAQEQRHLEKMTSLKRIEEANKRALTAESALKVRTSTSSSSGR